ncbi:MAG TPA: PAS domain S-box protein [Chthoniobacter sp.]|jgi:PAS domain S-box-containing protein
MSDRRTKAIFRGSLLFGLAAVGCSFLRRAFRGSKLASPGDFLSPPISPRLADLERARDQVTEFYRDVLDSLSASIAVIDREGCIVVVNEAWRRFSAENTPGFGADFIGVNYLAVCENAVKHDEDVIAARALVGIREVMCGARNEFEVEYPCHAPDRKRWFRLHVRPLSEEGRGVVLAHEDITQRYEAQEKLKLFRNLVDQSNDTIEVIDPETGRFLDVNAKGPAELGCTREEYLSRRVADIDNSFPPENWGRIVTQMRTAGFVSGEGNHRRADGTMFPIEFNAKVVRLDRDYVVAVIRDITERRRAEQRVRQQAAMLDMARDAILIRGFGDHVITFWNKGAERLYGWTAEEAVGRDVGALIYSDLAKREQIDGELLEKGDWRGEVHHLARNGAAIIVGTRATLVRDAEGNPQSVLVINTDITEQKELEIRFLRAQRMESLGTLASGIAHDLNNILCPIQLTAPLLRRDLPEEAREKIVTNIVTSAKRGRDIIRQVLAFGRGFGGEHRLLRLSSVVEASLGIVGETFPKDIAIETSFPSDLWLVIGDATQLQQVLLNLCLNARDAMPQGGRLRIAARNLDLTDSDAERLPGVKPGSTVLLEVSDTGVGIPREIRESIFDPFFTTKPHGNGTGLGLSTVLGILKSHGGHIAFQSEIGHGATFRIHLPASREISGADGASPHFSLPPAGHGECVLIVDDEIQVRDSAVLVLESHGYRTHVASDGVEALAIFSKYRADIAVILTDLMMPNLDGLALIGAIRKLDSDVPVIASTGLETKTHLAALEEMKINGLLAKPYGPEDLLRSLGDLLHLPPTAPDETL